MYFPLCGTVEQPPLNRYWSATRVCMRACVCECMCCSSVWRCVSCHDVVCTAQCTRTKLYLPHYKSLWGDAEKVNKRGKAWRSGVGAKVHVCYYVLHLVLCWSVSYSWIIRHQAGGSCLVPDGSSCTWPKQTLEFQKEAAGAARFGLFDVLFSLDAHWKEFLRLYLLRLPCNEVKLPQINSDQTDDDIV